MPLIRTDDGPMSLRQVWLGFPGFTFWVEWTYTRWFVTVVVAHVTTFTFFAVFLLLFGVLLGFGPETLILAGAGAVVCGIVSAIRLGGMITRGLSFDEPVLYRLAVLWEAWRLARKPAVLAPSRIEIVTPKSAGLGVGAARSLH